MKHVRTVFTRPFQQFMIFDGHFVISTDVLLLEQEWWPGRLLPQYDNIIVISFGS